MAFTIDIPDNLEKMLRDEAQSLGVPLDDYLADVLRRGSYKPHPIGNRGTREEPWISGYMSVTSFELEACGTDFRVFPSMVSACNNYSEARKRSLLEVKIEPFRQFSIYEPIQDDQQHFPLESEAVVFYQEVKTKILSLFEELRPLIGPYDYDQTRVRNVEEAIAFWFDYFDRLHSPLGLERAFHMAISWIFHHPRHIWIRQQAIEVAGDLGMVRERKRHLASIKEIEAFQREFPGETFDAWKNERWRFELWRNAQAKESKSED